jgi:hypothetical protein
LGLFSDHGEFFHYDDSLHLYRIVNTNWLEFLVTMHGGHLLITRNAVFLLNYELFAGAPAGYFWFALVTHLINVVLLFALVRGLTGSASLACFGAALWGILPAHEGTIGWYSAYGHALASTFVLLVLLGVVRAAYTTARSPDCARLDDTARSRYQLRVGIGSGVPIVTLPFRVAARNRAVLTLGYSRRRCRSSTSA